jgi:hypothetical protein
MLTRLKLEPVPEVRRLLRTASVSSYRRGSEKLVYMVHEQGRAEQSRAEQASTWAWENMQEKCKRELPARSPEAFVRSPAFAIRRVHLCLFLLGPPLPATFSSSAGLSATTRHLSLRRQPPTVTALVESLLALKPLSRLDCDISLGTVKVSTSRWTAPLDTQHRARWFLEGAGSSPGMDKREQSRLEDMLSKWCWGRRVHR